MAERPWRAERLAAVEAVFRSLLLTDFFARARPKRPAAGKQALRQLKPLVEYVQLRERTAALRAA